MLGGVRFVEQVRCALDDEVDTEIVRIGCIGPAPAPQLIIDLPIEQCKKSWRDYSNMSRIVDEIIVAGVWHVDIYSCLMLAHSIQLFHHAQEYARILADVLEAMIEYHFVGRVVVPRPRKRLEVVD